MKKALMEESSSNTFTSITTSGAFCGLHFQLLLSFPQHHSDLILMKQTSGGVGINPLISSFVSLYTLILLYFPSLFLDLLFSPVLISAGILLLYILRFGASQNQGNRNPIPSHADSDSNSPLLNKSHTTLSDSEDGSGPDPDPGCRGSFVEWDIGAPLEVIHEACCEGEDAPDDDVSTRPSILEQDRDRLGGGLHRYPSLSRYYPETDSDSDSNSDSDSGFSWAGEGIDGEKDGLFEIQIGGGCGKRKVLEEVEFHTEEDNFIEIDISSVAADGKR